MSLFEPIQKKTLRPYQSDAIDQLRSSLGRGNRRVVLQLATGGGKTFLAASIINLARAKNPRARVVFTVPLLSLIDQTVTSFRQEGIGDLGVIQGEHRLTNSDALTQIASVQTLARRGTVPEADLVIVDECHLRSRGIERMMEALPNAWFVGLSATPWRRGMAGEWQSLVVAATTSQLIELGMLSDFVVYAPHDPDLTGVKVRAGEFVEADLADRMDDKQVVGDVVTTWLEKGRNQPTLAFAVNRVTARHLADQFEEAGVASAYVDAYTDPIEREHLRHQFADGRLKVVCSVRTMTTGIDWPVGCIVDCAPTLSEMLHVQKIGRGLRVNPGLGDEHGRCIILDHAGNTSRLGFVTDIHHDKLLKGGAEVKPSVRKEALPKACKTCSFMIPPKTRTCPACGTEKALPPPVETVDGELSELVRGPKKAPTMLDKQRFWSMALWLDASRERGGKLALALYRGKFGVWPRGLNDEPQEPDVAFWNYERSRRIAYAKGRAKQQMGAAA